MKKRISEILHITIYIWFGIQSVLGCCWIICNLGAIPRFEESRELLAMSETLCVDEYTGYLYPLLLRVCTMVSEWSRIPACSIIYVLQLGVAYLSYEYFLQRVLFWDGWKRGVLHKRVPGFVVFVMTLPAVLQVHMAILPYSLASSMMIVLLTKIICISRKEYNVTGRDLVTLALLWIVSAQICIDYVWLSGILLIMGMLWYMWLHKQFFWKICIMLLVSIVCITGLNDTLQTPGSMGKIRQSTESVLLTRVVWPKFAQLADFWDDKVQTEFSGEELLGLSTYPEKVIYEFGPRMENLVGIDEAHRIYRHMIKQSLMLDTKYILKGIAMEGIAYLCPPLTMYLQLQGIGSSYTGWNYGRMKDYTPRLTDYYVDISMVGWVYLLLATLVLTFINAFSGERKSERKRKKVILSIAWCIIAGLGVDFWYVMTSGHMQDYKKVLVISVLWAFGLIAALNQTEEKYYLR